MTMPRATLVRYPSHTAIVLRVTRGIATPLDADDRWGCARTDLRLLSEELVALNGGALEPRGYPTISTLEDLLGGYPTVAVRWCNIDFAPPDATPIERAQQYARALLATTDRESDRFAIVCARLYRSVTRIDPVHRQHL